MGDNFEVRMVVEDQWRRDSEPRTPSAGQLTLARVDLQSTANSFMEPLIRPVLGDGGQWGRITPGTGTAPNLVT